MELDLRCYSEPAGKLRFISSEQTLQAHWELSGPSGQSMIANRHEPNHDDFHWLMIVALGHPGEKRAAYYEENGLRRRNDPLCGRQR